jgi:succinate-semialdehyde dehydrogenase/glutarate-semialdehyde dehydrogenase
MTATTATTTRDDAGTARSVAKVVPLWAQLRVPDRARYLKLAGQALIDEFDDLLGLLASELGRPRAEIATLQLLPSLDALDWIAEHGPQILGSRKLDVPRLRLGRSSGRITYEPLGVVGVVASRDTAWALPLGEVAAALIGGNGVLFKPSSAAPATGERLARLFVRAGLPEGLLQVVHGGHEAASSLVPGVTKLFASGSAEAVAALGRLAAEHETPLVAAPSGHDAMLVLEDAHLGRAVAGALWGAFAAAGQAPGSVGRALVARELVDRFADGVTEGARRLQVGNPLAPDTQIGPLAGDDRLADVTAAVEEAVAAGATLRCGGPVGNLDGPYYAPAVLTGVDTEMRVWRERVDGPVLSILAVDSADEAVAIVNDEPPTLGASVWTQDRYQAARLGRELHVGASWGNEHLVAPLVASAPWGGPRRGAGRPFGESGIRECVEEKVIGWRDPSLQARWRLPYHDSLEAAACALARFRSARDADRERALRTGLLPLARVALGRRRRRR